jgi:hypothetical protein
MTNSVNSHGNNDHVIGEITLSFSWSRLHWHEKGPRIKPECRLMSNFMPMSPAKRMERRRDSQLKRQEIP